MIKFKKLMAYIVIIIVLFVVTGLTYVSFALPDVGKPENIKVDVTPQRVARGKYLANHVTVCVDCHSSRDFTKFAGPIDSTVIGAGGDKFDKNIGFPGEVYVPNITPYHLKDWTDGELFRAITTGVKKDGSAIFPIMPYGAYSKMDREDIYSIIAYIRTLKPVKKTSPARKLDFPLNFIVNTIPQKAALGKLPAESDTLKYGEYLVRSAACIDCHSQDDKGKLLPGLEFAGGKAFSDAKRTVRSANITPDAKTGIGTWTKEQFIARFKQFSDPAKAAAVGPTEYQTAMPWFKYGGMKESDLGAIYTYLRTIKPVNNQVVKFELKK